MIFQTYGAMYSRMDQVKFVGDSLLKIWSNTEYVQTDFFKSILLI